MVYSIILFIIFSFFSYRLIGIRASLKRGLIASLLSFAFSSAVFYVFHLQNELPKKDLFYFDHYTFLYFITLVVVSLGFSLILEMTKVQVENSKLDASISTFDKMKYFVATRIRYINLLFIISKNGLLKSTFQANQKKRKQLASVAFRKTLEHAGGIFVKFGQFLSTRSDLFPQSFLNELSLLQEQVYPVEVDQVKNVIETQFNDSIKNLFQYFDEAPLAAASMAQVHRATLHNGDEVIVKVLRPRLKRQLAIDINILTNFARLLDQKTVWARRIGIVRLTEGFIQNLYEEANFLLELNNIQQMSNIQNPKVYIPKVYEDYSTSEVLVMEYLDGVSINKIDSMIKDDQKKHAIIDAIFKEMLAEIFEDGVFHGDPHPGNIMLLKNGEPAFIDFGSVGRLSALQKRGFKWLLIGLNKENVDSMISGVKDLVENSEEIDDKLLKQSLSQFLVEHSFEGNIMEDMGKELFDLMSSFGLRFFPDVAGAFRSLITLQGSLQTINPDFNLSKVIDTYLKDKTSVKNVINDSFRDLEDNLLNFASKVKSYPEKIDNIVQQVESGKITFRMSLFSDEDNIKYVNSFLSLLFTGLAGFAFGVLALGALFLAQAEDPSGYSILDVFGYSGLALSVTMLIRVAIRSIGKRQ